VNSANGDNDFGVSFGRIMFLQKILESHANVDLLERHDDIIFDIQRLKQDENLSVVCVEAYAASLELVMRVLEAFPKTNIIFVGGKWNGYTQEAYEFCSERRIGIYNAGELAGALHKDRFWTYEKLDENGNSTKSVKAG
jgi:hypothetical protein